MAGQNVLPTIEFESSEAKRAWASSMQALITSQEKLRRTGIASVMRVARDKVFISMSLSSVAKSIGKQIKPGQGTVSVELREKALVVTITK
ncbi:hypothetical protein KAX02_00050 [candidate division WOR-3 bacterium]|nr:hypothetical protein [candidate division WOR-3 bacterium]